MHMYYFSGVVGVVGVIFCRFLRNYNGQSHEIWVMHNSG